MDDVRDDLETLKDDEITSGEEGSPWGAGDGDADDTDTDTDTDADDADQDADADDL